MLLRIMMCLALTPWLIAQCDQWELLSPTATGDYRLQNAIWDGTRFVALTRGINDGGASMLISSQDGVSWTRHLMMPGSANSLAFNGEKYLLAGFGYTAVSPDLDTWETYDFNPYNPSAAAPGPGPDDWVVAYNGLIYHTQNDGETWTQVTDSGYIHEIRRYDDLLIGVGRLGLIVTSPNGLDWTTRLSTGDHGFSELVWNGSVYVATPWLGSNVYISSDGLSWAPHSITYSAATYGAVWNGSHFVLSTGTNFVISPDGMNWQPITSGAPSSTTFGSMASDGSRTVTGTSQGPIYIADNSFSWVQTQINISPGELNAAAGIRDSMIAFKRGTGSYLHKPNTQQPLSPMSFSASVYDVITHDDSFILAADHGRVGFGQDGLSWEYENVGGSDHIQHVAVGDGRIMAVDEIGRAYIRPIAGGSWAQMGLIPSDITTLSGSRTGFLAGGPSGALFSSTDGLDWQTVAVPTNEDLLDIVYNDGVGGDGYVIVGADATILYAADGLNWSLVQSGGGNLETVTFTGSQYLAGGDDGMLKSSDGLNWSIDTEAPSNRAIRSIGWTGSTAIAAGQWGLVMTSGPIPLIRRQPLDQSICPGDALELLILVENVLSFQWQKDGVDIPGATEYIYRVEQVQTSDMGAYTCVVQNNCETVTSQAAVVSGGFYQLAPAFDSVAQGLTPVTLSFNYPCDLEELSVTWIRDSDGAILATDVTALTLDPPPEETSLYHAEIVNSGSGETKVLSTVVLVSNNPMVLDPNGDGCNTPADLHTAAADWGSFSSIFEADTNPGIDIRDLLYININGGSCQ